MDYKINKIHKILDSENKEEKIKILESLNNTDDTNLIKKIVSKLDDPDIEVRGEAFSALISNKNEISDIIIESLNSENKNIRGFSALVLANRKDSVGIESLIELTKDQSGMVRACALGALGYLKAKQAKNVIHDCFCDSNLEVRKSALKAAIDIGERIQEKEFSELTKEKDEELENLLIHADKN